MELNDAAASSAEERWREANSSEMVVEVERETTSQSAEIAAIGIGSAWDSMLPSVKYCGSGARD